MYDVQQQVPTETKDDVLESQGNTEPLPSFAIQDVSENVQFDNAPSRTIQGSKYAYVPLCNCNYGHR